MSNGQDASDDPNERGATSADGGTVGTERTGPLAHLDVLDLTHALAGPFATMLLADLGANVLKVEPPDGDHTRDIQPKLNDESYGGYFHSVNRSKRSLVLDLKDPEGKAAFEELAAKADLLVENFRAGTMERLGLSYERLSESNPELIYGSIRGFGDRRGGESPYVDRPTVDVVSQAMGGIMSITGTEAEGPIKVGPGVGDIFPGVLCMVGVLSALSHREQTGEGQYVDVGMVDGILSLTERIVYQHSFTGEVPGPAGYSHPLLFPFGRFDADDGYVMIAANQDYQWATLCETMNQTELIEAYPDHEDRLESADSLRHVVNEWTSRHGKDEIVAELADDLPCAPVNTVEDIFEDEHFEIREMLPEVEHANTGETVRLAGTPIKFTKTPAGVQHRAPLLGEHTNEILEEMGIAEFIGSDAAGPPEERS